MGKRIGKRKALKREGEESFSNRTRSTPRSLLKPAIGRERRNTPDQQRKQNVSQLQWTF